MSSALLTASILSLVGLVFSFALGYTSSGVEDVLRHATLAIFITLITLLGHSMTMIYLIGKVRAIKDAVIEGDLRTDAVARVSALRGPVFKVISVAMGLTMVTAIVGGGVDNERMVDARERVKHALRDIGRPVKAGCRACLWSRSQRKRLGSDVRRAEACWHNGVAARA